MALLLLSIGVIINTVICVLAILKRHDKAAQYLLAVALGLTLWMITNYFSGLQGPLLVPLNRVVFIGPIVAVAFSYFFVMQLKQIPIPRRQGYTIIIGTIIMSLICLTPLVVPAVNAVDSAGRTILVPERGSFYYVYIIWLLIMTGLFVKALGKLKKNVTQRLRSQISVIRNAAVFALILGLSTNLFIPQIFPGSESYQFAPLTSVIFMSGLAITIFKYGLFDIKAVVARVIGYTVSVFLLAILYGFIIFATSTFVLGINLPLSTQIYIAIATGFASLFYGRLQQRFDKITNTIFYRDAYDVQALFEELNEALIASIDVSKLAESVSGTLKNNLKPEFCAIVLNDPRGSKRTLGVTEEQANKIVNVINKLSGNNDNTYITSELEESKASEFTLLDAASIGYITSLSNNKKKWKDSPGFLILGFKRSGNIYSIQDVKVLNIVKRELTIAFQNALQFEQIEKFNTTLQQKVDEATRHLRQSNEKLRALDESKDDFVSMASHQLRTPLTSVKGYLSMVLEGDAGNVNEQQRKMLEQAFISSQRMTFLIADLLNVSRLKTGKFIIEPTPTNLSELVKQEVLQLQDTAKSRNLSLVFNEPKDLPVLQLDETKTRQVVMNFIDNAIYYTPEGGTINIEIIQKPQTVELLVSDDGIGIPKSEQHHLFTKFYRAANAKRARPDGTGLGLFMAKKVIVAQGGAVIFRSTENKGSTFGFSIPIK